MRKLRKFQPDLYACTEAINSIINGSVDLQGSEDVAFILVVIPFNPAITDCSEAPMMATNMPQENAMIVLKDIVNANEQ